MSSILNGLLQSLFPQPVAGLTISAAPKPGLPGGDLLTYLQASRVFSPSGYGQSLGMKSGTNTGDPLIYQIQNSRLFGDSSAPGGMRGDFYTLKPSNPYLSENAPLIRGAKELLSLFTNGDAMGF